MFVMSELTVESVLREGLTALRRNPKILEDVFAQLLTPYLQKKYGDKELNKIKKFFCGKEISVVHAFSQVPSNVPCISIQLLDNPEDESKAHVEDYEDTIETPITDLQELQKLILVSDCAIISYDANSGILRVPDGVDLSQVRARNIYEDASGEEYPILGGVLNIPGTKQIILEKRLNLDVSAPGIIKNEINFTLNESRGVIETERIMMGIHTKEPLLTKYLYIVVKYIIESRKVDLITRGFQLPTYSGSDFTRALEYPGDQVYNRFLTLTGKTQNNWVAEIVVPIDEVDLAVLVDRDVATNEQVGRIDATVQVNDDHVNKDD